MFCIASLPVETFSESSHLNRFSLPLFSGKQFPRGFWRAMVKHAFDKTEGNERFLKIEFSEKEKRYA
jgi:hypothetical protein